MIGANWNLRRLVIALTAVLLTVGLVAGGSRMFAQRAKPAEPSHTAKANNSRFLPTETEWASLTVEPAKEEVFRTELIT